MTALNLGEIVATTLRNRNPSLADNITNDNGLWFTLNQKGHVKDVMGGRTLVEPIAYAENASAKWYDGYETFDIAEQADQIDAAEYDWKSLGGFAMISGMEGIKNSGKWAALNLIKSRIDVLEMTLTNAAGTASFADGTGTSGKEFGGLQLLIADDPTAAGTVGGIDQAANPFWQNQFDNQVGGGTTTTSANITGLMNLMWLATIRGKDKVDLISADSYMYTAYEESLQQQQRFADSKLGAAGFESLKYKTASVIYDDQCPANHMYFQNTRYLYVQCSPKRKFTVGESRKVTNSDYEVVPTWLAGNFTCSNRARQGVIIGETV
jgi:hypothetical protein